VLAFLFCLTYKKYHQLFKSGEIKGRDLEKRGRRNRANKRGWKREEDSERRRGEDKENGYHTQA
jgi:hypothetical protein